MKTVIPFIIPLFMFAPSPSHAGLLVTDPTLIATNQANAAKDLAESLLRKANQIKQIEQQLEQILQMSDYLKRYGHPDAHVAESEFHQLIQQLNSLQLSKSANAIDEGMRGEEVFTDSFTQDIVLDGATVAERNPDFYREQAEAKRGFEHYQEVQSAVLERRAQLRQAIASTAAQLQAASTESEIRKLSAMLIAQQTELSAIDKEMDFASGEVLSRHLRSEHEKRLRAKARLEVDRARHREGMLKNASFYRLMTKPVRFRAANS